MRRLLYAAFLALPFLAVVPQNAKAEGCCWNLQGCFRIKVCAVGFLKAWPECFGPCCAPCGSPGCGATATAPTGCCGGECWGGCSGQVPGPWYTYWPAPGVPMMTSPYTTDAWTYINHFQTPAPVGFPFWPATASPTAFAADNGANPYAAPVQPASYAPAYWYGR